MRTPQRNDAEFFYNLNANIQQEFRKYGDLDEATKKIFQKFKEDHPLILERLNILRSRSDNRTDLSADCSLAQNSKEQSSNEDKESFGANNNTTNNRSPLNEQIVGFDEDTYANYASVRSSEQLLNSVINNEDSIEEEFNNVSDVEMIEEGNDDLPSVEMNDSSKNRSCSANRNSLIGKNNSNIINNSNLNERHTIEGNETDENNSTNLNDDHIIEMESQTSSIDSDIAEALTQIVEEYSARNETNSEQSSGVMSVDEVLMSETVNEINKELSSDVNGVENIVLTPPLNFRDM